MHILHGKEMSLTSMIYLLLALSTLSAALPFTAAAFAGKSVIPRQLPGRLRVHYNSVKTKEENEAKPLDDSEAIGADKELEELEEFLDNLDFDDATVAMFKESKSEKLPRDTETKKKKKKKKASSRHSRRSSKKTPNAPFFSATPAHPRLGRSVPPRLLSLLPSS
mmetsp:Transcript_13011/g.37507  ORF Transcript_13011/g.37507 Transcript_13011/m.37507 type:complete len:165 (+) Transcript_13011:254-748(+)